MSRRDKCPHCGASLVGEPIPANLREHFGNVTHYGRAIGLVDPNLDRVVEWQCPDCEKTWGRGQ